VEAKPRALKNGEYKKKTEVAEVIYEEAEDDERSISREGYLKLSLKSLSKIQWLVEKKS
jgi:hypothetical protein